jgi:hypothetical protein
VSDEAAPSVDLSLRFIVHRFKAFKTVAPTLSVETVDERMSLSDDAGDDMVDIDMDVDAASSTARDLAQRGSWLSACVRLRAHTSEVIDWFSKGAMMEHFRRYASRVRLQN